LLASEADRGWLGRRCPGGASQASTHGSQPAPRRSSAPGPSFAPPSSTRRPGPCHVGIGDDRLLGAAAMGRSATHNIDEHKFEGEGRRRCMPPLRPRLALRARAGCTAGHAAGTPALFTALQQPWQGTPMTRKLLVVAAVAAIAWLADEGDGHRTRCAGPQHRRPDHPGRHRELPQALQQVVDAAKLLLGPTGRG
jgi:hypothetical protein